MVEAVFWWFNVESVLNNGESLQIQSIYALLA